VTLPKPTDDVAFRRVRAGQGRARRAILATLRDEPRDVAGLAAQLGLHPNAVRQQLAVLAEGGLVTAEVVREPGRIGRPRTIYRAAATAAANPFERLARLLVEVAKGRDPAVVGAEEGAALASAAGTGLDDTVAAVATETGFRPRAQRAGRTTWLELAACPFADLAGPVVCGLHRGIVAGAAGVRGGVVRDFHVVDPRTGPCIATIELLEKGTS
jgi:predicted ArsR family transcriptional regulator